MFVAVKSAFVASEKSSLKRSISSGAAASSSCSAVAIRVSSAFSSAETAATAETLSSFENKLNDSEGFFKCHRSYIVYIPNVDNFNASEINTRSGYRIPIARGYGKAFKEAYFAYMFQN